MGDVGTDPAAGQAVTPGIEGGPCNNHVRGKSFDQLEHGGGSLLHVVRKKPVSADHRAHDLGFLAQGLLEGAARTGYSGHCLGRKVRFIFAANPAKKLIQIMNDAHDQYSCAVTPRTLVSMVAA